MKPKYEVMYMSTFKVRKIVDQEATTGFYIKILDLPIEFQDWHGPFKSQFDARRAMDSIFTV